MTIEESPSVQVLIGHTVSSRSIEKDHNAIPSARSNRLCASGLQIYHLSWVRRGLHAETDRVGKYHCRENGEPKTRRATRADEVKTKTYIVLDNSAKSLKASQKKFVHELRQSKFTHTFNPCEWGLERSIDANNVAMNFLSNLKVYFETKSRTSYSRGLNIFGRQSMDSYMSCSLVR